MPASKETIAAELLNYFKRQGLRQREVAESVGISKSHASNLLSGRDKFGFITAHKFADVYPDLNVGFLVNGEGSLLKTGGQPAEHMKIYTDSASAQEEILKLREALARKTREADRLLGIIETLTKK